MLSDLLHGLALPSKLDEEEPRLDLLRSTITWFVRIKLYADLIVYVPKQVCDHDTKSSSPRLTGICRMLFARFSGKMALISSESHDLESYLIKVLTVWSAGMGTKEHTECGKYPGIQLSDMILVVMPLPMPHRTPFYSKSLPKRILHHV